MEECEISLKMKSTAIGMPTGSGMNLIPFYISMYLLLFVTLLSIVE